MEDFDHHSEAFAQNWRSVYARLRAECAVAHTDRHGGYYVVTRSDDILQVLRDAGSFASARRPLEGLPGEQGVTIPPNPFRMGLMEMDPPESSRYRRLLNPYFSRAAVDRFRPRIRGLVTWCIDRFVERGAFDVVDDLANPVPALVTLARLGVPLDRWPTYARVLHEAVYRKPGSARQVVELLEDLNSIVRKRECEAGGLIEDLLAAEVDGQPLPEDLVVEFLYMLLSGGVDTTTALIASALLHLDEHPDDRRRLVAEPQRIPAAVQELIRLYSPATGVARTVTCPVDVAGVALQPGDRLLLALGSADADETKFDDPARAVFDRESNPHLAFGSGAHRCLGAELASAEMEILLEEVLIRLPDFRIDRAATIRYPTIPLVNGFIRMPASCTPGRCLGPAGAELVDLARRS